MLSLDDLVDEPCPAITAGMQKIGFFLEREQKTEAQRPANLQKLTSTVGLEHDAQEGVYGTVSIQALWHTHKCVNITAQTFTFSN